MAHTPVNHPLRPMYRALGLLAGVYLVAFGVVGLIQTSGDDFTGLTGTLVLGQESNMLLSIVSLVLGAIVVVGVVIGRNLDVAVEKYVGWGVLVLGSYGMATSHVDANFFGMRIATVVVLYIVGTALITASLYSKTAPDSRTGAPRQVREGRAA